MNRVDSQGRTALMAACYMGHLDIARILVGAGANVDLMDAEGRSALALAVLGSSGKHSAPDVEVGAFGDSENDDFVELLMLLLDASKDKGALLNAVDKSGGSLLQHLAFDGTAKACEVLISNGADPEGASESGSGWSPVHAAASAGNMEVMDALLAHGASLDAIDREGRTVLSLAAAGGKPEMCQHLLHKGLDELHRDNHGWIPLHLATLENKSDVIQVLCTHNPSTIEEVDREGRHPLILAAEENALDAATALLAFNPPVNIASLNGHTPLRVACLTQSRSMAELLISRGADPDMVDLDGRSTLFVMILQKIPSVAELLLCQGASPDARDLMGRTPLHVASYLGRTDLVDMLLKWGTNVNATDQSKRTPLLTATWQGELQACKLLLDYSAKPDIPCKEGATPLHVAAQLGREDIVRVLLQYSADHSLTDSSGRTAADVAQLAGFDSVAKLLTFQENPLTGVSQSSTQDSSGIGSGVGYGTMESPYRRLDDETPHDKTSEPIDHIIADMTHQIPPPPSQTKDKVFNTHSSSLSNYTLSSNASLGSNPETQAMDSSAVFTQCLLERSLSQKRAKEALNPALARSAYSEPNGDGATSPTGGYLYRSRPRIVTNPRCRPKNSPTLPPASAFSTS